MTPDTCRNLKKLFLGTKSIFLAAAAAAAAVAWDLLLLEAAAAAPSFSFFLSSEGCFIYILDSSNSSSITLRTCQFGSSSRSN